MEMKTSASSFFCPLNSKKVCWAGAQAEGDFFVPPVLVWEAGAKKELTKLDFFCQSGVDHRWATEKLEESRQWRARIS